MATSSDGIYSDGKVVKLFFQPSLTGNFENSRIFSTLYSMALYQKLLVSNYPDSVVDEVAQKIFKTQIYFTLIGVLST